MMGLAGHGMLIAPVLPCRVARLEDLLVIGRGYQGPLLTELIIRGGKAPASEPPAEVEPDTYALGPDGPTLTLDGVALADMVLQIDVGVGSGEWDVLAAGFWFSLPKAMALYSPEEEGELPELHHPMNLQAFIGFARVGRDASELVIGAPGGGALPVALLETPYGNVRTFAYEYTHDGAAWVQQKLALPYGEGRTILMSAQAPQPLWADVYAAAVHVARSFSPITEE